VIYPLAYISLTSALSVVLVAVGLAGQAALAAELAVIQGALLATFHAFSANTRSLILQGHGELTPERLLAKRVVALPLLGAACWVLCVIAAGVSPLLALVLVGRRACEWLVEVRLCEIEVAQQKRWARWALAVQAVVTIGAAAVLAVAPQAALAALAVFAVSPILAAPPRLRRAAFEWRTLGATLRGVTTHIGSTAIDGISTYVLRLVVFLVAGAQMAGLLFTAFVLGSFVATLFANVLGPSLALRRTREAGGGRGLIAAAILALAVPGALISAAALASRLAPGAGKPGYFWLALGLSLLGAAIMIAVQLVRLRLFDERRAEVLFGPDVLRNLTAIIAAPSLYYLVAPAALGGLYLVLVLLTAFFYWGAWRDAELPAQASTALRAAIAVAVALPLFFLLSGRIYRSPAAPELDPGGNMMSVPLPLSLAACFAGVVLLGRYRHAVLALGTTFFLFVAMVLTSVVASGGDIAYESRKFLLLFQFLVPVFALALGQMFGAPQQGLRIAGGAFAAVLAAVVPLQLIRSIGYGEHELYHDLGLFSIYQHLQYVPSVLVCAYFVALHALWGRPLLRRLLVMGGALMAWYVAMSYSTLAIALMGGAALLVLLFRPREPAARWLAGITALALALALYISHNTTHAWQKFETTRAATEFRLAQAPPETHVSRRLVDALPGPAQVRLYYWALFGRGIVESERTFLFGHAQAIDRSVAPSAHNYYLDFVYNFGVLAFLPFAWLLGHTLWLAWRGRAALRLDFALLGLAMVVAFGLGLESTFKVPLRQPYPGIFFFFLWGLLLARLRPLRG
jgi:hypothetical protein